MYSKYHRLNVYKVGACLVPMSKIAHSLLCTPAEPHLIPYSALADPITFLTACQLIPSHFV